MPTQDIYNCKPVDTVINNGSETVHEEGPGNTVTKDNRAKHIPTITEIATKYALKWTHYNYYK